MEQLEKQLQQQAQILGGLNMQLNKYMEENQKVSLEIVKLQERIVKKKKIIEQEGKDKSIIHEKLLQAEQKKQKLQIQIGDKQIKQEEQPTPQQPQIKRPEFLNKSPIKKQQKTQQKPQIIYESSGKGQYKPPLLLLPPEDEEGEKDENEKQDEDQNEQHDQEKLLESVRKKLQNLEYQDEQQNEAEKTD